MINKVWIIIAAALFAGSVTGSAMAEDMATGGGQASADFAELDTNQDQMISREEAGNDAELIENWAEVDTDQNGMVDITEFSAFEVTESGEGSSPAE